jgi:phosphoserine aminotransferase
MRVYNFSAGPAMMPRVVLERAARELPEVNGTGQSVVEMSHRSGEFKEIIEKTERDLREILSIPRGYHVLFLQGGGWMQFAMVPLNLAAVEDGLPRKNATYIDTGVWAGKAAGEAAKYVDVNIGASSKDKSYSYIPSAPPPQADDAYYYICLNNTIVGTRWPELPETGSVPLVADFSSSALSEPLDVGRFGLLFAGVQKNLGPAGLVVAIIRDSLPLSPPQWAPAMLRYDTHIKEKSLFNTPPTFSIYMVGLVLEWIKGEGGLAVIEARNIEKSKLLYDFLDESKQFRPLVSDRRSRSRMNVTFTAGSEERDREFNAAAAKNGLINLGGHRIVGGLRASIYNAMPYEGVLKLINFMKEFEAKNVAH